mgnify:CR=1 FL=1
MTMELTILPSAPGWFRDALAVPCTDEFVEVDGVAIHYLAWGEPGRRMPKARKSYMPNRIAKCRSVTA